MIKRITKTFWLSAVLFLIFSCASRKDIAYFQDANTDEVTEILNNTSPLIKSDDLLTIIVSSSKPELARPYNLFSIRDNLNENQSLRSELESYQVDKEGYIDFPTLGKLKVAGLTRDQLAQMIKDRLANLVPNPVVTVSFVNFKITVMGEVSRPGSFTIKGDRVTILDAVGLAGDLSVFGRRDNILVVREVNGKREIARVDIKSKNIFKSPYYYLQQNDVVYVEPNKAKADTGSSFRLNFPLFVSAGSLLVSIATLLTVSLSK